MKINKKLKSFNFILFHFMIKIIGIKFNFDIDNIYKFVIR
jgi:hypothetical protein